MEKLKRRQNEFITVLDAKKLSQECKLKLFETIKEKACLNEILIRLHEDVKRHYEQLKHYLKLERTESKALVFARMPDIQEVISRFAEALKMFVRIRTGRLRADKKQRKSGFFENSSEKLAKKKKEKKISLFMKVDAWPVKKRSTRAQSLLKPLEQ